jgi:integrase
MEWYIMLLRDSSLKKIEYKKSSYYIYDEVEFPKGGLCIKVPPISLSSKKKPISFVFKYAKILNQKKKVFQITLGRFPALKVDEARRIARTYSEMLQRGLDPKEVIKDEEIQKQAEQDRLAAIKQAEEQQATLEDLITSYIDHLVDTGKRSADKIHKALKADVYPIIPPATKANQVKADHIRQVLAVMIGRGAPVQSNRIRTYLSAAFNHALRYDNDPLHYHKDKLFNLEYNPVANIPKQSHVEKTSDHFLNIDEVHRLLSCADDYFPCDVSILIKLCFYLGGQRPNEIFSSKWDQVNFKEKTFEISAGIAKNGRAHLIPLTETALELFEGLHAINGKEQYLFPRKTASGHLTASYLSKAIQKFCHAAHFPKFIPRDIRRTCKTLQGEIGLSKEIRDRLQNHALTDVSSKHYDRYSYFPEKVKALEAWEARLNTIHHTSNVIAIGA